VDKGQSAVENSNSAQKLKLSIKTQTQHNTCILALSDTRNTAKHIWGFEHTTHSHAHAHNTRTHNARTTHAHANAYTHNTRTRTRTRTRTHIHTRTHTHTHTRTPQRYAHAPSQRLGHRPCPHARARSCASIRRPIRTPYSGRATCCWPRGTRFPLPHLGKVWKWGCFGLGFCHDVGVECSFKCSWPWEGHSPLPHLGKCEKLGILWGDSVRAEFGITTLHRQS